MKKIVLILAVILTCSCGGDSNSNVEPSNVLLRKIITHNLGTVYETNFIYDGKKLVEERSNRRRRLITYNGDFIVRVDIYNSPDTLNELLYYVEFEYLPDGKLQKYVSHRDGNPDDKYTVAFTYNTDGTITQTASSSVATDITVGKLTIENGEVTKYEAITSTYPQNSFIYRHDNKNHPLKNVIGFDKLVLYNYGSSSIHSEIGITSNGGNMQNTISFEYSDIPELNPDLGYFPTYIEYNNDNFPISINKDNPNVADFLFYE